MTDAGAASRPCIACHVPLGPDQRYCLACGARNGPRAAALEALLARIPSPVLAGAAPPVVAGVAARPRSGAWSPTLPTPRASAMLVLGLLGFGVIVGAAAGSRAGDTLAASARPPLRIILPPPAPVAPSAPSAPPPVTPAPTPAPVAAPTPAPAAPAPARATQPSSSSGGGQLDTPTTTTGGGGGTTTTTGSGSALPPIRHVFVVMLGDQPESQMFGPQSPATYLNKTLAAQGVLLPRYYGVAHDELANEVALISGQAPTPQIAFNCPTYGDVVPPPAGSPAGTPSQGCVFPRTTPTVADQLLTARHTWRVYAQDMGAATPAQPATCRHPAVNGVDPTLQPRPGDGYANYRNPFAYFHSLIDDPACPAQQVGLDRLPADLASVGSTPSLSYIVPSLCFDGRSAACPPAPASPGSAPPAAPASGPAAADAFLRVVIPGIIASPAYRDGGLVVITTDQAPTSGPGADSSSCCGQPRFDTTAGTTTSGNPGGGQVGALVISRYVKPGTVDSDAYNHFSLLRTIEDLFSLGHLGHAADVGVTSFDATVFGNWHAPGAGSSTTTSTSTTTTSTSTTTATTTAVRRPRGAGRGARHGLRRSARHR